MDNKIRVLVLDDNIHVEHYALEDKTYSSLEEFVARELRKPHSQEYEFRTVCLDFNIEDDFFELFLNRRCQCENKQTRALVFARLWAKGDSWYA